MSGYQYYIDKQNRLILIRNNKKLHVPGAFALGRQNNLLYKITKNKIWRQKYALPPVIAFEGRWELDKQHELTCMLRKSGRLLKTQKIYLRAQLDKAKRRQLIFAVSANPKLQPNRITLFRFNGRWKADKKNRLAFLLAGHNTQQKSLTLESEWSVNNNTLVYRYRRICLKTKINKQILLRFKGFWKFDTPGRLTYVFDADKKSGFSFRLHKGPDSIRAEKGVIKYRLGFGGKTLNKTIEIFGLWQWKGKASLGFQVQYARKNVHSISFSVGIKAAKNQKIKLVLRNKKGGNLGISLEIEKRFLKAKGRVFLRAAKRYQHPRVECGVDLRF